MWTERQVEKYTQAKEFSYIVLMCTIFFFFKSNSTSLQTRYVLAFKWWFWVVSGKAKTVIIDFYNISNITSATVREAVYNSIASALCNDRQHYQLPVNDWMTAIMPILTISCHPLLALCSVHYVDQGLICHLLSFVLMEIITVTPCSTLFCFYFYSYGTQNCNCRRRQQASSGFDLPLTCTHPQWYILYRIKVIFLLRYYKNFNCVVWQSYATLQWS